MFAAPSSEGPARVGVVAGRRVGTAVRRNRAKRRLRAALAGQALPSATAYVVVAGPAVPDVPFDRLGEWLTGALDAPGVGSVEEKM